MSVCKSCGGVLGRDCFNPDECEWITRDQERQEAYQAGVDSAVPADTVQPAAAFETALNAYGTAERANNAVTPGDRYEALCRRGAAEFALREVIAAHTTALSRAREEERKNLSHFVIREFLRDLKRAVDYRKEQDKSGGMTVGMPQVSIDLNLQRAEQLTKLLSPGAPTP